jgi:hypothetical protein
MTERTRKELANRGERYTREVADAQLKRLGLTLSDDWWPKGPLALDRTRERLKNQGVEFTRKTAELMLTEEEFLP